MNVIHETRRAHQIRSLGWFSLLGGLSLPEDTLRSVARDSTLTWFIKNIMLEIHCSQILQ